MDELITDDGSKTYHNPIVDEWYHTKAGAVVEALEKHARALKVWEKQNPLIFDVCSGLSYSAACALEEIRKHGNDSLVTIYLFENDRSILEKNLELPDVIDYDQEGIRHQITCFYHFKNTIQNYLKDDIKVYQTKNLCIILKFGDVNNTLSTVEGSADYVFFAPFSPQATPNMWTYDLFKKIYVRTALGGKLSTYSYAKKVRDALKEAGFKVENGPILGRRSPSLIGVKERL
ncbi:MAG: MnmC family methyltransferase [Candidatus Woesearchaeota archaeon]